MVDQDQNVIAAVEEVFRLRKLLRAARQFVNDAGDDEDPEAKRRATDLLAQIDEALPNR